MMTPEEIQQVVEDYKKSNSLNEIFNDKTMNFLRNFGRNPKDKVNIEKDKEKNGNGAQGATNGAQGAQSSTSGAQGAQGAQSNDNVGAQGNGAQSSSTGAQGAQGAQSNDNVGAQGATNGAQGNQGAETNTVKKNEIDLDAIKKYSRNNREITIKDFGGIKPSGAQGAQTNEVKPNVNDKLLSTYIPVVSKTKLGSTVRPVTPGSARDKAIAKNEIIHGSDNIVKKREMNADFQAMKRGDITKLDFMKQYPDSQTTKKYNLDQISKGKQPIKSQYEPYDLVLDYVLSEGHADNIEEAHYVMMQMDEETIQTIIKENPFVKTALVGLGGYMGYKGLKAAGDKFNNMLNNLRNNSKLGGNKRVDDVRKNSGDPNVGQKINFGAQGNKP